MLIQHKLVISMVMLANPANISRDGASSSQFTRNDSANIKKYAYLCDFFSIIYCVMSVLTNKLLSCFNDSQHKTISKHKPDFSQGIYIRIHKHYLYRKVNIIRSL